jgi:hypothetical protein
MGKSEGAGIMLDVFGLAQAGDRSNEGRHEPRKIIMIPYPGHCEIAYAVP